MPENLVATTIRSDFRPLAFQGIMAYSSFPQIRQMLRNKFDDDYALLFTKPEENPGADSIDWYSPVQGEPRRLSELPAEDAEILRARMASMAEDIYNYGEELIKTSEPLKVTRGRILLLALSYPNEDSLYAVGGQPVFVNWGFAPGTPGVEPMRLYKLKIDRPPKLEKKAAPAPEKAAEQAAKNPEPPSEPRPTPLAPVARPSGCFWWILPALLLALLLALLFVGVGSTGALSGYTLFKIPAPDWWLADGKSDEIDSLRSEIARLRESLGRKAEMCVPEKTAEPAREEAKEALVIPKSATSADFLAGRWLCETGLSNARTNEPVKVEFSFDSSGRGVAVTYEENDKCEGPTRARLDDGVLFISVDEQICGKSSSRYAPITIRCEEGASGEALCQGLNEDGSKWNARFKKY